MSCAGCDECFGDKPNKYQVHVSVLTKSVEAFENACDDLGIKPMVIKDYFDRLSPRTSVFTASSYGSEYQAHSAIERIEKEFEQRGIKPIRAKIEMAPFDLRGDTSVIMARARYWETHFKVPLQYQYFDLIPTELHISENWNETRDYFYLTLRNKYRHYTKNMQLNHAAYIEMLLKQAGIQILKTRTELCILDTNEALDEIYLGR